MSAIGIFREILVLNKKDRRAGIFSICSAREAVLKAGMLQAKEDNSILLIESTSNLRKTGIPLALISQYLPNQYLQVRQGRIKCDPQALVFSKIREVLSIYSDACGMKKQVSINEYRMSNKE